jgi:23S rRNA pseudouridine1911/1915/1917 synthase
MSDAPRDATCSPEIIEVRFTVEPSCHRWRLDHYLRHKIRRLSRNRIAQVIRETLTLNGRPVHKPGVRVRRGDAILIQRPAPVEPDVPRQVTLVARGPGFVAVDKPAGLPVHPTARYLHNTLTGVIRERFGPQSGLNMAHRLDRETSGLVLFGTDPESTRALKASFRRGEVRKRYVALVRGRLEQPRRVEAPIGPAPGSEIRIRMGVRPDGRPACTRLRPLERLGDFTLLEARPETGRQHQIRVHLEHLGMPVVGDKLYGHPDAFFLELVENGLTAQLRETLLLPRHALHAAALRFPRPDGSRHATRVEAPLPDDLTRLIARLRAGAPNAGV